MTPHQTPSPLRPHNVWKHVPELGFLDFGGCLQVQSQIW